MKRSLFQLPSLRSVCLPCRQKMARASKFCQLRIPQKRLLTTTSHHLIESNSSTIDSLTKLSESLTSRFGDSPSYEPVIPEYAIRSSSTSLTRTEIVRPHHLHVYATRHNCHITLTTGTRDPIFSFSSGNIGFRKAQRGTYDAAFQLGVYVMGLINNQAMLDERYQGKGGQIRQLELILRDFGPGREALTKIILGGEGRALRSRIVRVMDSTRLKFGGSRSKKPRRLG